MSRATLKAIQAAAGNAGEAVVYADDVFSTYLYDGTNSNQFINNGIALGNFPFTSVASTDGANITGSETFSVNVTAGTKLVVFALDSSNSILSCTLDGASLTAKTSSTSFYGVAVFIETLTAGTHTIVVGDNNIGHTEIMLFDSNATVSVETNLTVSAQGDTSVTTSAVTTDGFCVFLGSDRDPNANFSANQTSTEYYDSAHTYFYFGAIGINGSSGTVPATTISGMVGTFATNWCLLKVEGIGNDPTANSAATGEGGLVWIKDRSTALNNILEDTERGADRYLRSNTTNAELVGGNCVTAFTFSGFKTGTNGAVANSGDNFVSWTFRKQPGFFDVVTYTGTGNAGTPQTINHNLDSAPAVILVKKTNSAQDWLIFSKDTSQPHNKYLILNSNVSEQNYDNIWGPNGYLPTTTEFKVDHIANDSGATYVAYLFADNDQRFGTGSDEAIIKSNSVSATGLMTVDLGFEPQWVLIKSVSIPNGWILADSMRGLSATGIGPNDLFPNSTSAEGVEDTDKINLTSTGFTFNSSRFNGNGTYLYIAIRRPHKPASEFAAIDLFDPVVGQTSGKPNFSSSTGVVDALFRTLKTSDPGYPILASRLTSPNYLITSSTAAEVTFPTPTTKFHFAMNDGWGDNIGGTSTNVFVHMLRRAPGFFDVVGYAGVGGGQTINHGLGAVPEMIVIKNRTQPVVEPWTVGHHGLNGGSNPWEYWVQLNDVNAEQDLASSFADFQPTTTQFKVGNDRRVDFGGNNFIAYLFATVSGISKVGSYTGTGSDVNVNCGFTSGARFVLVKRADSTGGWYVWDSANGITAGNDPYILLNSTAGQTTGTDYIDPLSSGFTITSTAPAALNASGGNYIFLAIA